MSSSLFTKEALRIVVAQICQKMGWKKTKQIPLEVLVDLLHRYMEKITRGMQSYAEHFDHSVPTLDVLALVFTKLGVKVEELKEYATQVDSNCTLVVPHYPLRQEPRLNFLDPNSREAEVRPIHVYEYLPPMYPNMESHEPGQNSTKEERNTRTLGITKLKFRQLTQLGKVTYSIL